MEPVVTSNEMREFDRITIEDIGIPGIVLMENAGRGVVLAMIEKYGDLGGKSVLIICGKGNNGGDGFVVARHLYNQGAYVNVVLIGKSTELKGDAYTNYSILEKIIREENDKNLIKFQEFRNIKELEKFKNFDFIVDAIFGTGFSGEVKGNYKTIIEWINKSGLPVISIDIPSGINSDNGWIENIAIKSDLTVTMGLKKIGLSIGKSVDYINDLKVVDISIPKNLPLKRNPQTFQIETDDIIKVLPKRKKTAHKYSVGKVFALAGSRGYTGAAAMASQSVMQIGVGAVILGTPNDVYPILAKKLTEVMVNPLEATSEGTLSIKALPKIKKFIDWADILIIGCGLSLNQETAEVVSNIINEIEKPMLIDADGLTILSENVLKFKKRKSKNIILTPHIGEFSRLTKINTKEIEKNSVQLSREFAKEYKLTLVLKGAPSITASNKGLVFINSTGNPGMATAGSGDVLAGIIGGLWGQKMDDFSAAYSGVFVHGLAGDLAKNKLGEKSMMALDINRQIPSAIRMLEMRA